MVIALIHDVGWGVDPVLRKQPLLTFAPWLASGASEEKR
jgi:hypothetical protein